MQQRRPQPSELINLDYYSQSTGMVFRAKSDAYEHFRDQGQSAGLNPSAYFHSRWYEWQNPQSTKFASVLDHFIEYGSIAPIDPAPFVDIVGLLRLIGGSSSVEAYQKLLADRNTLLQPNLSVALERLHKNRGEVHKAIRSAVLKNKPSDRKRLVWVQAGTSFKPSKWFEPGAPRSWDLLCNWYTLAGIDLRLGEILIRQSGTKATAIHHILTHHPEILDHYDQILFLDDDLYVDHRDLDTVFDIAESNQFDMFQPSVAPGSQCVWPALFQRRESNCRSVSGCEIMMFGFSNRALRLCKPLFSRSVSGFGLDFQCSETVRAQGWRCGVVDRVAVEHLEEIDEKGGAYYEFMRSLGINQKLELFEAIRVTGILPTFRDLHSVASNEPPSAAGW